MLGHVGLAQAGGRDDVADGTRPFAHSKQAGEAGRVGQAPEEYGQQGGRGNGFEQGSSGATYN